MPLSASVVRMRSDVASLPATARPGAECACAGRGRSGRPGWAAGSGAARCAEFAAALFVPVRGQEVEPVHGRPLCVTC